MKRYEHPDTSYLYFFVLNLASGSQTVLCVLEKNSDFGLEQHLIYHVLVPVRAEVRKAQEERRKNGKELKN